MANDDSVIAFCSLTADGVQGRIAELQKKIVCHMDKIHDIMLFTHQCNDKVVCVPCESECDTFGFSW